MRNAEQGAILLQRHLSFLFPYASCALGRLLEHNREGI